MLLGILRDGVYLDKGVLNSENKLDGEGPFRVVVPQKVPGPPYQSSTSENQNVTWPYNDTRDHNAGSSTRTVTIIKVEPMPEGTTDIDVLEAGWAYVDQAKIIIYGAGTDSNGNGILDSEEMGSDPNSDIDNDSIPDFQDSDTVSFRHASGNERLTMHTSDGAFSNVVALDSDDPMVPQDGKPSMRYPYGVMKYEITGLDPNAVNPIDPNQGESVAINIVFPDKILAKLRLKPTRLKTAFLAELRDAGC